MTEGKKLGIGALAALVLGSMIGGGVFSLPQNMAAGAATGAILIGWVITGMGMIALALVYQDLSMRKPNLDAGPFSYARAGFGDFVGFNSAWGYWISAWLGNVSYMVLFFSALSFIFPVFGSGNNWQSIIGASILVWLTNALVLKGVKEAAIVNLVTTIAKMVPLLVFIVAVLIAFKVKTFDLDFWGKGNIHLGSIVTQVKSTMLVTLWVFIGIEGATVVSGRAKRRSDIGKATIIGLLGALVIYVMVSVLSMGVMSQPELAGLKNPSTAGVLEAIMGPWGAKLIAVALIISLGGAFLAWTMLAAEIPYVAARCGVMPKIFSRENTNGSPAASLWVTNSLVQLFLIFTLFAKGTYQSLFSVASTAILVPYIFSGAFAWKLAQTGESYKEGEKRGGNLLKGVIATIYGCWLVYAAGLAELLMCAILYAPGIFFFMKAGKEREAKHMFTGPEKIIAIGLVIAAIVAIVLMARGTIRPL